MAEATLEPGAQPAAQPGSDWPLLPTETEIYLLPDGRVVVADLPLELAALAAALGVVEPCAIAPAADAAAPDPEAGAS